MFADYGRILQATSATSVLLLLLRRTRTQLSIPIILQAFVNTLSNALLRVLHFTLFTYKNNSFLLDLNFIIVLWSEKFSLTNFFLKYFHVLRSSRSELIIFLIVETWNVGFYKEKLKCHIFYKTFYNEFLECSFI